MTSHLTRRVFRSILANEPIVHAECLRRRCYGTIQHFTEPRTRCGARNGRTLVPSYEKRTMFLSMFEGGKKTDNSDADFDPGIEKMMEYDKMRRMNARLPPPEDVAMAFTQFFNHKHSRRQQVEDTQADLAAKSLRYYLDSGRKIEPDGSSRDSITSKTLHNASAVLKRTTSQTASHVDLTRLIYDIWSTCSGWKKTQAVQAHVRALALSGHPHRARDFVLQFQTQDDSAGLRSNYVDDDDDGLQSEMADDEVTAAPGARLVADVWREVLAGFARQDSERDLLQTLDMLRAHAPFSSRLVPREMLYFYLRGDQADQVKSWFSQYWQSTMEQLERKPSDRVLSASAEIVNRVLRWCLQHDELDFGHDVVRQALSATPPKAIWDAIFVWAAGTGKGADEIDRMFSVMESANTKVTDRSKWDMPDITTINALVEYATSKNDPYLAERFIAIGKARDIHPDANTYVLQMKYRLKISDVDGALIAYKNLQSMDLSSNEDVPTVNELIVALCKSSRHDFDTIMNVAADLSDRKARFEPATASALALLHLNRDEVHDVTDLMNTHAYHYSADERDAIRRDLVAYCLNSKTRLSRVWDAYNVLVDVFDEMPRDERTQIMLVFFRQERPDVSVNIFITMRQHYREDTIPTIDTYVAAFLASAKLRDLDTLEVIHNQLKLDYNIDTTTYLMNALMIGYSACGNPRRALTFWDDIVASKEGPTYNSIHIALRACEKSPFGDLKAEKIWAKLRSMNIDLDQALWSSYIAALAGNGNTDKAISTLEEGHSKGEVDVDTFLVGSLFMACSGQVPQAAVEGWCKERFPQIWEELEKGGVEEDENGMRSFKIDRTVTP